MSLLDEYFDRGRNAAEQAEKIRKSRFGQGLNFHVPFLDDALEGIYPHDLVLIGAPTGSGKTDLVTNIANRNAEQGKRVFLFALEAERAEIEIRTAFTQLKPDMSFRKFYYGHGDFNLSASYPENMNVYYRKPNQDFDVEEFDKILLAIQNSADLIILDHFHFLDFGLEQSENRSHKIAIKKIRDIALSLGVRIILVAHLNKAYSKNTDWIPRATDFYGTGDLVNVTTKVVMLSNRVPEDFESDSGGYMPTTFHVPKFRVDGSVRMYCGILNFDPETRSYAPKYALVDLEGKMVTNLPSWAVNSSNAGRRRL